MSSSVSADFSPTSNYSYPSELTLSPTSPTRQSRSYADNTIPPRLSSPHIFRDIFSSEAAGPSVRSPPRLPPLHEINFAETMQDVNRALQSANRAIQTAQEAFQSRRTPTINPNRRQDVVDLTGSPPSPAADDNLFDSFLTRTLHPHDPRTNTFAIHSTLNEPFYPQTAPAVNSQPLFVEQQEDDPTSHYAGQSDSLAGARRRYELQRLNQRRPYISMPVMDRSYFRPGIAAPDTRRQDEEDAIRRQRLARQTWEQNQQRQQQREQDHMRQVQLRTRMQSSQQNPQSQTNSQNNSQNAAGGSSLGHTSHSQSSPRRPPTQGSTSSSSSSIEDIDLSTVNTSTDLAAALLHSQSQNNMADPTGPDSAQPRSALTAYKCPICLEPPRNATTTVCGHLFCHECILETLKNSENIRREDAPPHRKVKGQCPVCRKELARKEEGPTRTLVPLEIKMVSRQKMEELRRLEKKRQRVAETNRTKTKSKGKEKATEDGVAVKTQEVFELSSDDDDDFEGNAESQKENRAKRLKLSGSEEFDHELFNSFLDPQHT